MLRYILKSLIRTIALVITLSVIPLNLHGQEEDFSDLPFSERMFFGGNFGFSFGSITFIEIAPTVGYRLTPLIDAGISPKYMYYSDNYYKVKTNIYGGSVFGRIRLFKDLSEALPVGPRTSIFLHTEYEALNINSVFTNGENAREWINSMWIGGGLSYPISARGRVSIFVLYDILHTNHPLYSNPQLKIGFEF